MAQAISKQIKHVEEQIALKQKKLEDLKARQNDVSNTTHAKIVTGGDCVKAGVVLSPRDKLAHRAFVEYLKKYKPSIDKFIVEYKSAHEESDTVPVTESSAENNRSCENVF